MQPRPPGPHFRNLLMLFFMQVIYTSCSALQPKSLARVGVVVKTPRVSCSGFPATFVASPGRNRTSISHPLLAPLATGVQRYV